MAPQVSVIIPARNEEASLGACLESFGEQGGFSFEVIVVDDHSTDRTKEIAKSAAGVQIIEADPLRPGWTGKNNAIATGLRLARCEWILFTDADTVHLPGSLERALSEAREYQADLLSYSPEQIAVTFWERATLPVVFAELASQYPPSKVSDPNWPDAAANGQYILVNRKAYEAIGGHAAVASEILEDVALARAFKKAGYKIRFRYAPDAVRTRMYRNFRQLREGWTKNLALLFPDPGWLAAKTLFFWALPLFGLLMPLAVALGVHLLRADSRAHEIFLALARLIRHWFFVWYGIVAITAAHNRIGIRRAKFSSMMESLGMSFGMPMFAYLLLRSKRVHSKGSVDWKGRSYDQNDSAAKGNRQPAVSAGRIS
ncbi:MAG TPA: glycosyltransferase family 2 protein [Candidatus Sulfotelmatobacter sp.]